jgi:hypothetical protein
MFPFIARFVCVVHQWDWQRERERERVRGHAISLDRLRKSLIGNADRGSIVPESVMRDAVILLIGPLPRGGNLTDKEHA